VVVDDLLADHRDDTDKPTVVGDSAYADGATRQALDDAGFEVVSRCPPVRNSTGGFTKDHFAVDLDAGTVTCPADRTVAIRFSLRGGGKASFKPHCTHCPLRAQCTPSHRGRTIAIHPQEALLQRARVEQTDADWTAGYRADRPIVERKIAHFVRRAWGGRKARTRGKARVSTDVDTRAAAINWARLATLGLIFRDGAWAIT
jgi:Transposase DDE domain